LKRLETAEVEKRLVGARLQEKKRCSWTKKKLRERRHRFKRTPWKKGEDSLWTRDRYMGESFQLGEKNETGISLKG